MLISMINCVADEPDPTARVKMMIKLMRTVIPNCTFEQDKFFSEMDERSVFLAAAIVSGGHVHDDMSMVFEGKAAAG